MILAAALPVFADGGIAGDVNGDGKVNNKDVSALFKHVSGISVTVDETGADCNGDGSVNNKDVSLLFKYVSGMDVQIFYGKAEIIVPDVTMTYVTAHVYADKAEADEYGLETANNGNLSTWFAATVEFDENFEVAAPKAFGMLDGYVLRIAQGQYIESVNVFKVSKRSDIPAVREMAEFRRDKQRNNKDFELYDDSEKRNEKMLDTGKVVVIGSFVVYAVTLDTNVSILRAQKYVQDHPDCTAYELYCAIVPEIAG